MHGVRAPAVAGSFYPKDEIVLREMLSEFLADSPSSPKSPSRFLLVPHAGYIYSGRFAGEIYRRVEIPKRVVILCPNHTGLGSRVAVWSQGEWKTPLGRVPVDAAFAARFLGHCALAEADETAHLREHAIEVHLPFLQVLNPDVRIVPIVLSRLSWAECSELGEALAAAISAEKSEPTLVVASSDMSHYIPASLAKQKDDLALQYWKSLDAAGLYQTVRSELISMCGFIPASCTLVAGGLLGAVRGELVAYGNSGEVTGESDSVVAYAAGQLL